jgi:ribulose-phosphate 3-epimerase
MGRILLSASVACADLKNLARAVRALETAGIDSLHFDMCDGHFAPTLLLSPVILAALRPLTKMRFDAHLYCEYPSTYIDELASAGTNMVIIHVESEESCLKALNKTKTHGMGAGLGILPSTSIGGKVQDALGYVDFVLVNLVGPAYAGQPPDPRGLRNLRRLRQMIDRGGLEVPIGVDGAVSSSSLPELVDLGASLLVCGTSSIFHRGTTISEGVKSVRKQAEAAAAGLAARQGRSGPAQQKLKGASKD